MSLLLKDCINKNDTQKIMNYFNVQEFNHGTVGGGQEIQKLARYK